MGTEIIYHNELQYTTTLFRAEGIGLRGLGREEWELLPKSGLAARMASPFNLGCRQAFAKGAGTLAGIRIMSRNGNDRPEPRTGLSALIVEFLEFSMRFLYLRILP